MTVNLNGISYGNELYVVVGSSGTIITSSDGTSWTETADTAASGQRINMGGGTTVAGIITRASGTDAQAKSTEEFTADAALATVTVS